VPRVDLLTVGEAFEDLIFVGLPRLPRAGEEVKTSRLVSTVGGGAVITAVAAARLGLRTAVISGLSLDAARLLRREKIQVVNLRRAREMHAISVSMSTPQNRSFVTYNGVNDRLEARLPRALGRHRAAHVHFAFAPRDCRRWARLVSRLGARRVSTSWDFGWHPSLWRARGFRVLLRSIDYLFVNAAEARLYSGRRGSAAAAFWKRTARNTVIKLGARGSRLVGKGIDVSAPAPSVRVVDTTGAGDAFNGGFLSGLLEGRSPRECLRLGNFVGARSTLAAGGIASPSSRRARLVKPTRPTRRARPPRPV
jgi:sugar/nucleoside kinase (ribokinase family)